MEPATYLDKPNGLAARLIKAKVSQMIDRCGFRECDREDLQQELYLELLTQMPRYDARRASFGSFIKCVIQSRAIRLVKHKKSGGRNYHTPEFSLNTTVVNDQGETGEYVDFVDQNGRLTMTSGSLRHTESHVEGTDLSIDIKNLCLDLDRVLLDLWDRMKTKKVAEISRETGVPRTTLYGRISKIRQQFQEAGI